MTDCSRLYGVQFSVANHSSVAEPYNRYYSEGCTTRRHRITATLSLRTCAPEPVKPANMHTPVGLQTRALKRNQDDMPKDGGLGGVAVTNTHHHDTRQSAGRPLADHLTDCTSDGESATNETCNHLRMRRDEGISKAEMAKGNKSNADKKVSRDRIIWKLLRTLARAHPEHKNDGGRVPHKSRATRSIAAGDSIKSPTPSALPPSPAGLSRAATRAAKCRWHTPPPPQGPAADLPVISPAHAVI